MVFGKSFPRTSEKSSYPVWEEIFLTEEEEREEERKAREENVKLMKECIDDARTIIKDKGMKGFETSIINVAIALFEKRASHQVFWKESKCKEKFDAKKLKD
ncbi:hypothetical protein D6745_00615 [Candidatus Woesearchaeota archaeon]|nr:MAG: hypothetical protein D6745_00615 [Candidatus Woesearchaeota archaeon]